jgi:hypothetical protein
VPLVEDDHADAGLIQDALAGTADSCTGYNTLHAEWVTRLSMHPHGRAAGREGIAMFHAKAWGRGNYQCFRSGMKCSADRRLSVDG